MHVSPETVQLPEQQAACSEARQGRHRGRDGDVEDSPVPVPLADRGARGHHLQPRVKDLQDEERRQEEGGLS